MIGTTAGNTLDGFTDGPRSPLAEAPAPAEVEAELQRIARRRLAPPTETGAATQSQRNARSFRQRRQPLPGAFDSPEGFAFGSVDPKR